MLDDSDDWRNLRVQNGPKWSKVQRIQSWKRLKVLWSLAHHRGSDFPQARGKCLLLLQTPGLMWNHNHAMGANGLHQLCQLVIIDVAKTHLPRFAHALRRNRRNRLRRLRRLLGKSAGGIPGLPESHIHNLLEQSVPNGRDGPKVPSTMQVVVLVVLGSDDEWQSWHLRNPTKGWQVVARMYHHSIPGREHEICKGDLGAQLKPSGHQHKVAVLDDGIAQCFHWMFHLVRPWFRDADWVVNLVIAVHGWQVQNAVP